MTTTLSRATGNALATVSVVAAIAGILVWGAMAANLLWIITFGSHDEPAGAIFFPLFFVLPYLIVTYGELNHRSRPTLVLTGTALALITTLPLLAVSIILPMLLLPVCAALFVGCLRFITDSLSNGWTAASLVIVTALGVVAVTAIVALN